MGALPDAKKGEFSFKHRFEQTCAAWTLAQSSRRITQSEWQKVFDHIVPDAASWQALMQRAEEIAGPERRGFFPEAIHWWKALREILRQRNNGDDD